jgi:hypothetical protein
MTYAETRMSLKKLERRRLCSELLILNFRFASGPECRTEVNLEEIWPSGALFQTDTQIRRSAQLRFAGGGREFLGEAVSITRCPILGYFVEMRFAPACRWSEGQYRPKYLFNPQALGQEVLGLGPGQPEQQGRNASVVHDGDTFIEHVAWCSHDAC